MFKHLLAIAVADVTVNHTVSHQLRLRNQLSFALFGLDEILNGVAVKGVRQGDVNHEVAEQHKAQILLCRTAHGVMQTRF
ncbi:hypothetical protein D3C71_1916950 [compost metagenome]